MEEGKQGRHGNGGREDGRGWKHGKEGRRGAFPSARGAGP